LQKLRDSLTTTSFLILPGAEATRALHARNISAATAFCFRRISSADLVQCAPNQPAQLLEACCDRVCGQSRHVLLATGFFLFIYLDASDAASFGVYLFNRSNFWELITIFDTAAMFVIVGLFSMFERAGVNPPGLVAVTVGLTYVIGTLQWFLVGGAVGAILERFFEGLKTPDPDEDWDKF
jgi:hypothetical protein